MSGPGAHTGSNAGDAVRKGVGLVHGLGEGIRGNVNAAIDGAAGHHEGVARNEAIASHGAEEIDHGYHRNGTAAGVGSVDTARTQPMHQAQGYNAQPGHTSQAGSTIPSSTNYGPHDTNLGNKLDPRVDSDLDHRGYQTVGSNTAHGSTNHGPHSSNAGNKLDPRVDSDVDHRGTTQAPANYGLHHANFVGDSLDPRHDANTSTNHGPHHSNAANKLDPRTDSDRDHREKAGSSNYGLHNTNVSNKLDPKIHSDPDHRGPGTHAQTSSTGHPPHKIGILNKLDPRVDSQHDPYLCLLEPPKPGVLRHESEPMLLPFTSAYEDMEARHALQDAAFEKQQRAHNSASSRRSPHLYQGQEWDYGTSYHCQCGLEYKECCKQPYGSQHLPHSNRLMNVLDPRVAALSPTGPPHSNEYPHKSQLLNVLDFRVDKEKNARRKNRSKSDQ